MAIDARDGRVAAHGWNETTDVDALELAATVEGWGVLRVQFTDVRRDGTLGPEPGSARSARPPDEPAYHAAGGVSDVADLVRLAALEAHGVDEAIVGKALYEGRLTLAGAHAVLGPAGGPDARRSGSSPASTSTAAVS